MTETSITARLRQVHGRIHAAALRAGRPPEDITLVAVSKKQPADAVRAAHAAGQRAFGESYLREALDKVEQLSALDLEWHFIGRVQSNKTRQIAAHFDWVHGLCDPGHAQRLSDQRPAGAPPLNVCLQINLSQEASKSGVEPADAPALLAACAALPGLRVQGLMTLPAPADSESAQHEPLAALRRLRDKLATPTHPLPCLSMGMSDDLEAAILEGATHVRIGTAIFGPRPYN